MKVFYIFKVLELYCILLCIGLIIYIAPYCGEKEIGEEDGIEFNVGDRCIFRCENIEAWDFRYLGSNTTAGNGSYEHIFLNVAAQRHFAALFLGIHMLIVFYHLFSHCYSKIPFSRPANRNITVVSLLIWIGIVSWITVSKIMWANYFAEAQYVPQFPATHNYVLFLSVFMFFILALEVLDHDSLFMERNVKKARPHTGYLPAYQNDKEYISDLVNSIEMNNIAPENRSIVREIDIKKCTVRNNKM